MPTSKSENIRDRFERAIRNAADGIHDATQWWDANDADDNGQRPIDRLLDTLTDIANGRDWQHCQPWPGMTLRQHYAGLAMAQHANDYCAEDAATWAVRYADALLAELAKEQNK